MTFQSVHYRIEGQLGIANDRDFEGSNQGG